MDAGSAATGKRLLLFTGAGFSAQAGAPVMGKFLEAVQSASELPEAVYRGIRAGYYFPKYALRADDNLETAYGSLVFRQLLHHPRWQIATFKRSGEFIPSCEGPAVGEAIEAFETGIAAIYGSRLMARREEWLRLYKRFLGWLLDRFEVTVVTTNYDLIVETTLGGLGVQASYCFGSEEAVSPDAGMVPILKLHGSVNWDRSQPQRSTPSDPPKERAFVLPPTWNKDINAQSPLRSVWRKAVQRLAMADLLLAIGHSFPVSDTHLQYLFAEGLSRRREEPEQKRVVVVDADPDTCCRVSERLDKYQTVTGCRQVPSPFGDLVSDLEQERVSI